MGVEGRTHAHFHVVRAQVVLLVQQFKVVPPGSHEPGDTRSQQHVARMPREPQADGEPRGGWGGQAPGRSLRGWQCGRGSTGAEGQCVRARCHWILTHKGTPTPSHSPLGLRHLGAELGEFSRRRPLRASLGGGGDTEGVGVVCHLLVAPAPSLFLRSWRGQGPEAAGSRLRQWGARMDGIRWEGGRAELGSALWNGGTLPTKATSWAPAGLSLGLSQNSELSSEATENWTSPRPQNTGSGRGPLPAPRPHRPRARTILRRVDEAEHPESVVLPLGGHGQLLHSGARLGAATSDVKTPAANLPRPAPPPHPPGVRPPHSRGGTAGSGGSSSGGPRRRHTSPRTRAG